MAVSEAIARRYAQAYFDLANQAGEVEPWGRELERVAQALTDPEVARALENPRLRGPERAKLVGSLLESVEPRTGNLVRLLVERGRLAALPAVVAHYRRLADRASGVVRAEVIAAVAVDEQAAARLRRTLSEKLGGEVETTVTQDPSILGGLVIRIGDRVIDGSVRTRLQQLRTALT
jgi:F-type H+-transporting ATPase subunit delta